MDSPTYGGLRWAVGIYRFDCPAVPVLRRLHAGVARRPHSRPVVAGAHSGGVRSRKFIHSLSFVSHYHSRHPPPIRAYNQQPESLRLRTFCDIIHVSSQARAHTTSKAEETCFASDTKGIILE